MLRLHNDARMPAISTGHIDGRLQGHWDGRFDGHLTPFGGPFWTAHFDGHLDG